MSQWSAVDNGSYTYDPGLLLDNLQLLNTTLNEFVSLVAEENRGIRIEEIDRRFVRSAVDVVYNVWRFVQRLLIEE